MKKNHNYVVIMAGGKGTRLWPMSRTNKPKQLQKIIGNLSLIQQTYKRLKLIFSDKNIFISTNQTYKGLISEQLPSIPKNNYIIEPLAKNTAPAIGLVCAKILKTDPQAIISTIASDHVVGKKLIFANSLEVCQKYIQTNPNMIGTIGIKPNSPHTGYGYIKFSKLLKKYNKFKILKVDKFVEKPDLETAKKYLASNKYLWNASYFTFKAASVFEYFKKFEPKIYKLLEKIYQAIGTSKETKIIQSQFNKMPELAFDYLIEKISDIFVIPVDIGWDDIGSWEAIKDNLEQSDKNVERGNCLSIDNRNCLVYAQDKLIAAVGLKNIVIVDTKDATLICDKKHSQDVKKIIEIIQKHKKLHKYL